MNDEKYLLKYFNVSLYCRLSNEMLDRTSNTKHQSCRAHLTWESINSGLDYWNGGLTNIKPLAPYLSYYISNCNEMLEYACLEHQTQNIRAAEMGVDWTTGMVD